MMEFQTMFLAFALAVLVSPSEGETPSPEIMSLLEFREKADVDAWRPVHDGVMGGVSSGRATLVEGSASSGAVRFEGRVSLDNNGGFASFRRQVQWQKAADYDGLRLRVRGDGQTYKLSLRTDDAWDGVSWQVPFTPPAGEWVAVDFAFVDLAPTWRGRLVPDAGPFDPSAIRELGILISDRQAGHFVLELSSVEAWRAEKRDPALPQAP